ncbi:hypothetical protein [Fusobacterium varium]|nr:hypothetical protein [Fusobacterium varium]
MGNEITDRELLAICNLSNLRMEFANLIYEETESKTGKKSFQIIQFIHS